MKKQSIAAIMLMFALCSTAQSKLDIGSRMALRHYQLEQNSTGDTPKYKSKSAIGTNVPAMVKLAEGYDASDLEAEGFAVSFVRGDIAVVSMPLSEVETLSCSPAIRTMQISRPVHTAMDLARSSAGVDKIHEGIDLPRAYTGKGVMAATVDQGIDHRHINFRDADGNSRISYLSHVYIDSRAQMGYVSREYDSSNIDNFTTDTDETFHSTHTLGIMAGGYRGKVEAGVKENSLVASVEEIDNPYYGVAPEANIATSCGDLQDVLIAQGVENIINAAQYAGQPSVISMSLGSTLGPHDSRSLMCQFLDVAADYTIICLSAGNEGDLPIALSKTATEENTTVRTFIEPYAYSGAANRNVRYGQIYVYSDDDTPFEIKGVIYNKRRGVVAYNMPITDGQEESAAQYYSSTQEADNDIVSSNFSRAFDGYFGIGYFVDRDYTGRYYALMDYYTLDNTSTNANGDYILGFEVTAKPGQRIDAYCDAVTTCFNSYGQEGWDDGSTDGSISDMACGNKVLVVGSYNTRDDWASLDGEVYGYHGRFPAGKVSSFSSYGTLADGRELPHVCAPGAALISSTSSYFVESSYNGVEEADIQAIAVEDNRRNYWMQAVGTSMSTPYVAGSIALWLEANPNLDIDEIKEIVRTTAVRDEDVTDDERVRWGAGKFDAYAGLKEAIRLSGIEGVTEAADSRLMVRHLGERAYEVFLGHSDKIEATVYNVAGRAVLKASADGDQLTLDASQLTPGVYILNVNGAHSQRILVK